MEKPITIRAQFGDQIYVSHHRSWRGPQNRRYHAREIADMAVTLGADWAQGWIGGERVAWIVAAQCQQELGLTPREGERRVGADDVWAALELETPLAAIAPAAWSEED